MKIKEEENIKKEIVSFNDNLHFGVDTSKWSGANFAGNEFWILIIDNKKLEHSGTDMFWMNFLRRKVIYLRLWMSFQYAGEEKKTCKNYQD